VEPLCTRPYASQDKHETTIDKVITDYLASEDAAAGALPWERVQLSFEKVYTLFVFLLVITNGKQ
jgi:hypothetical protein